jgi:hypothetical protein
VRVGIFAAAILRLIRFHERRQHRHFIDGAESMSPTQTCCVLAALRLCRPAFVCASTLASGCRSTAHREDADG